MIHEQNTWTPPEVSRQIITELEERAWDNLEPLKGEDRFYHRLILQLLFPYREQGMTHQDLVTALQELLTDNPSYGEFDPETTIAALTDLLNWQPALVNLFRQDIYCLTIDGQATTALMSELSNSSRLPQ